MVSHVTCPSCQGSAAHMPVLSSIGFVDYYQCQSCGAVSHTPKEATGTEESLAPDPAETEESPRAVRV